MKKWIALLVLGLLLVLAYVVAGPFLAFNAIGDAVRKGNTAALSRHVDFPALRVNLRAQVDDYVVRRAGPDIQSNPFGAIAVQVASGMAGAAANAMATPAGVGAMLEGRSIWHRVSGGGIRDGDAYAHVPPRDPLENAEYGFESASRFTATTYSDNGEPVVFVLTRQGLRWKVSDIRLPLAEPHGAR